jgi:hypothetical protein
MRDTPAAIHVADLLQKNDDAYAKALQSCKISDLFMISASDKDLAMGAALFQKNGSPQARSLFASLIESHEINSVSPADYGSARRRSRLMKTLFAADDAEAARTEARAAQGSAEIRRLSGLSRANPVHGSGIGNYVAEFAEAPRAQSIHICVMAVKARNLSIRELASLRNCAPSTLKTTPALVTSSPC